MPPRSHHPFRTNIYLGPFERALLAYIQRAVNLTASEQIREAIPLYVRSHPVFEPGRLRDFVERVYLPQIKRREDCDAVLQGLDLLLRGQVAPSPDAPRAPPAALRPSPAHFDLGLAPDERSRLHKGFRSKPSDFDID
jgi:hypothetical protein